MCKRPSSHNRIEKEFHSFIHFLVESIQLRMGYKNSLCCYIENCIINKIIYFVIKKMGMGIKVEDFFKGRIHFNNLLPSRRTIYDFMSPKMEWILHDHHRILCCTMEGPCKDFEKIFTTFCWVWFAILYSNLLDELKFFQTFKVLKIFNFTKSLKLLKTYFLKFFQTIKLLLIFKLIWIFKLLNFLNRF